MRVIVAFAMDQEFRPWRRMHAFERIGAFKPPLFAARMKGMDVRVVLTGVGPRNAKSAMKIALDSGADFCISAGLAGGLRSRHRSGDVLAAHTVLDASGVVLEKCDPTMFRLAVTCGAHEAEAFRSLERIVPTAAEKGRLAATADAVEMESFVVLAEARAAGVPAVAIRTVGDPAEQDLPLDFEKALGASGEVKVGGILAQLARNPLRLPAVARLGQQTQRAAMLLAGFLDRYIGMLGAEVQHQPRAAAG